MGIINELSLHVANLIAAGEVVERPAFCVKELVENALDAAATEITVEIKRGGVQFLRVTDNGCGMSADDMPISLKRHATSKIKTEDDLDGIMTLGFRGEALAAISSVSNIRIMSKRKEDKTGHMLIASFGKVEDIFETGCQKGTTVIVENLFSNVPARRKFLKRDVSEAMAVTALVEKLALSHPDVSFRMISDNNEKFTTAGDGKLLSAIYAVMGRDFAKSLYDVNSLTLGIGVKGYTCRPDAMRANRNFQITYINGRYFKSKTVTAAIEQAYDSYTEAGKFPSCVLFVDIHPTLVDVNVHPTKLEVKFSNERAVFDAVYCAVKNALVKTDTLVETQHIKPEQRSYYNAFAPVYDKLAESAEAENPPADPPADLQTNTPLNPPEAAKTGDVDIDDMLTISVPRLENEVKEENKAAKPSMQYIPQSFGGVGKGSSFPIPTTVQDKSVPFVENNYSFGKSTPIVQTANSVIPSYRIIGVAFSAYIFVEIGEKTMIIDKHAAHERIIFESMKIMMEAQKKAKQMLLLPLGTSLSPEEYSALLEWREDIAALGFEYELNPNENEVCITQIPSFMKEDEALTMFVALAGNLASGTGSIESTRKTFFEKSLYQASCKSAMKAGIMDDDVNIKWLVESLLALPDIRYCPHGRPVMFEISKKEIEKYFKR